MLLSLFTVSTWTTAVRNQGEDKDEGRAEFEYIIMYSYAYRYIPA